LSSIALAVSGWSLINHRLVEAYEILGHQMLLTPLRQVLLIGLAIWLIIAFLFTWRVSDGGGAIFPVLLLVYSIIAISIFFDELVIKALFLKIAWFVVILLVPGRTGGTTRAGTRLLILAVLAMPPFLVASALIAERLYEPEAVAFTSIIILALGMGFALMLPVIPFHAWLPQVAEDGPPLIAAWIVAGMGSSYLLILFELLARYQWLAENEQVQRLLFGSGLLMAIGGPLLIVTERHLGRLWSYAILANLGYILLGLSFGSGSGMLAGLLIIVTRLVSLLLAGCALATIRQSATTLYFDSIVGIAPKLPLSILGFAIGGLAMLGTPLTSGFPGHWAVLGLMAKTSSGWTLALISSSLLGVIGFLRAFAVMVTPIEKKRLARIQPEPTLATLFLLALAGISLIIGIVPQTMNPLFAYFLGSLNLF
jgi:formate hydrogenlyase subunit 3/multisubunit Na+/H+ antiporter MnhD subunit